MSFFQLSMAALALTTGVANGHLIMQMPVPYGMSSINNSPLVDAKPGTSESDYPCKLRSGVYDISVINYVQTEQPNEISFTGSASHGGGTCQLAVTTDQEPAANSTFKLIQTFYNCPTDNSGNGGTHPFTWTLPKGTPNGALTFAWLWFNKIGNREAYMNCAPIYVSGGSDSLDYYDSLPNMFLANLPSSDCSTIESTDAEIPNPGQFLLKDGATSVAAATGPSCKASAAAQTEGVSGYKSDISSNGAAATAPAKNGISTKAATAWPAGGAAKPTAASSYGGSSQAAMTSAAATSSAAASSAQASAPASSAPSAGSGAASFVTISTAGPAAGGESSAASPAYPTMAASSASAGVAAPTGASTSGSSSGGSYGGGSSPSSSSGMTCSPDGMQFGVDVNSKTVWRPVAPGTKCVNGQITKRSVLRHAHVRRHIQNADQN